MLNSVTETAAAKINLYLHVTGRRSDGYHELQSLVAFADVGDTVTAVAAQEWSLKIGGPQAARLSIENGDDNLVMRAARRVLARHDKKAALTLIKNLPVSAGIGGGSADAAAALRCLHRLFSADLGKPDAWADLGADIPVCLLNRPALVEGMGEQLTPLSVLPNLPAVLVNPGEPSGTGAVFRALAGRYGQALAAPLPDQNSIQSPEALVAWLQNSRNDLTEPAIETLPAIGTVLEALNAVPSILMARMSGSGATCFGLFPTDNAAKMAAAAMAMEHPSWWVKPTMFR